MCDFVTIIIPIFFVTDTSFIKIFGGKYLDESTTLFEGLLSTDQQIIGLRESSLPIKL